MRRPPSNSKSKSERPAAAPRRAGRPSAYSTAIANRICRRLALGESLRSVCRSDGMPDRETVMRWLDAHPAFAAEYARARDIGIDERADELEERMAAERDVQRARMIGEHGRWYLSKLAPRRYGDRLSLAGDSDAPLTVQVLRLTDASD